MGHDRSALHSLDSLAAPREASADLGLPDQASGAQPGPSNQHRPSESRLSEDRLGGDGAVSAGLQEAAPAIARFRAPVHPSDRPKLESFDQKIGKQPNAVQVRTLSAVLSEQLATCMDVWAWAAAQCGSCGLSNVVEMTVWQQRMPDRAAPALCVMRRMAGPDSRLST